MAKKPETRLLGRIRRELKKHVGGKWIKIHGSMFQEIGLSDLIGCVAGLYFALEVKTRTGSPSYEQKEFIKTIKACGGCAAIVTTPEQAVDIIEEHLRTAGRLTEARRRLRAPKEDRRTPVRHRNRKDVDYGRRHRKDVASGLSRFDYRSTDK